MKYYLATMFALPLLKLFDDWRRSRTVDLQQGVMWDPGGRMFGWTEARGAWSGCANDVVRVFWLEVPFIRHWGPRFGNFEQDMGWTKLQILHIHYASRTASEWRLQWISA